MGETRPERAQTNPPVAISESYYRRIVEEFGYSTFDLQQFDFELADMGQDELNIRYLCHHAADRYIATPPHRRIVTTGFGMSGPPHMATASHIMKIARLQEGGERCQIVLGDLDAYNGRAQPYGYARELAERFRIFATRLGVDDGCGVLRDQVTCHEALTNMYLLGRCAGDADFESAEEDNHQYYVAMGIVDPTMTFRRRLSLALMAADFVTLGQAYDAVLVLLGVDEHKYVRFAQNVSARFDDDVPLRGDFSLAAVYARLNTGFNGHPKFSKSIPGSSIGVETPPDEIVRQVRSDHARDPAASPVFQLMQQMTYCSFEELIRLYSLCSRGSSPWATEKDRFADFLVQVGEQWP